MFNYLVRGKVDRKLSIWHHSGILVGVLLLLLYLNAYYSSENYDRQLHKRAQKHFINEEKKLSEKIENISALLISNVFPSLFTAENCNNKPAIKDYIYVYKNDSLIFWSGNKVVEGEFLPIIAINNQLLQLSNGWYYVKIKKQGIYNIIGLVLVKNNYSIHNQFLSNTFNSSFNLPNGVIIKPKSKISNFNIYNSAGEKVFCLDYSKSINTKSSRFHIIILFALLFIGILLLYRNIIKIQKKYWTKFFVIVAGGCFLIFIKQLMVQLKFPQNLYELSLFQSSNFAVSEFLPSLGDLFLTSCIIFCIVYYAYKELHVEIPVYWRNKLPGYAIIILSLSAVIISFLSSNELFENVIYNTNITFDMLDFLNSGYFTFFGIISIALLFAVFLFISDFIIKSFFIESDFKKTLLIILIITILIFVLYYIESKDFDIASPLIVLISFGTIIYVRKYRNHNFNYRNILFFAFVFTFYSVYNVYYIMDKKSANERKSLAANMSERDPVAEYLFIGLYNSLNTDSTIQRVVFKRNVDKPWLDKYIRKNFFSGYFEKYDMQVILCKQGDSVLINPLLVYRPCAEYFENILKSSSEEIAETNFYFLKNSMGRTSYISLIQYSDSVKHKSVSVIIQLDSKQIITEVGYPELLLDERFSRENKKYGYSFARYYKGRLVSQSGNFPYAISSDEYKPFKIKKFGKYDHIFYMPDKNNLIILSRPSIKVFDIIVSFSYLFIFYFLTLNLFLILVRSKWINFKIQNDFKSKIRISIIGILVISLLSVGTITIHYLVKQHNDKNIEDIKEKLQSVYAEMESRLSLEKSLNYNWNNYEFSNLEDFLRSMSSNLYTDINLYNLNGRLIASSRSEVFEKGLIGNYMNPSAFCEMAQRKKSEFIQNERTGNLEYMSIYTPFYNNQNQILGYLNIPYFTKQSTLRNEISSLLLTVINFYVILILVSIAFAVFISEKITSPLRYLQEKFSKIKLGESYERIAYTSKDEIGDLVQEYNRMVDELGHSVELLAKSERESAWREMAKQVAHEIKNPLTPMKLSIQQLQRAWNDKSENLNEYFAEVTKLIIEQIDNLSHIATEFSNFAKMPRTKPERIELGNLLNGIIKLFSESGVKIMLHMENEQNYFVFADKEQLSRVFINLATNAIQAIPDNRQGIIEIILKQLENNIMIIVHDNGQGIPDNLLSKMFQPNFTTKSAGMGLGLAISKSIIENSGGKINVSTTVGEGTTFTIILPEALG
jgi:signal transduction histidine kinase